MKGTRTNARTKRDLIIATWNLLDRSAVGEPELHQIQESLRRQFGDGAVESPAAIARILADEGAELRHPEVIEFDAHWREKQIETGNAHDIAELDRLAAAKPLQLKHAETLIRKMEQLRERFERDGHGQALRRLREDAVNARQAAQALAKRDQLSRRVRAEQIEIAQWLSVWIRTPKLFNEWLELRQRSPEFRERFATEKDC